LLWSSEIKALLASGLVEARPDRREIDHFFNFYCMGSTRTCFSSVDELLSPESIRSAGYFDPIR